MKVKAIHPYTGPVGNSGLVEVYDLEVPPWHTYRLACGVVVSNSKRISMLDVNALISAGAIKTLEDVGAIRGQKNEEHWLQLMLGHTPARTRVPFTYRKFHDQLRAAGINVVPEGGKVHIMALTNKDVHKLTGDRELKSGDTVKFDSEMRPVPGGLFDPSLTGGHGGQRWAGITLDEPMPSPVMEEPIRRILKLTQKKYEDVIAGQHELPGFGTGPGAIARALDKINLPAEIVATRIAAETGPKSQRDDAYRRLAYLKSADKLNMHPRDWVLDKIPVLPPAFRPVGVIGATGVPLISDTNYLYKEALEANANLKAMKKDVGDSEAGAERLALYHAFKAVTGLGDPITVKSQDRNVKGVLKSIFGSTAKFGTVQKRLLSSTVDNVARAVVIPDPDLDIDSVGLPEDRAFDLYGKFAVRRLTRRGLPIREALRHVRDKTPLAKDALMKEMDERPVYVNRAPVLHKFGIMAFKPRLVSGSVLRVPPMIVKGFGMDFDGDAVQIHVPSSDDAKQEALERLLPSKNLLSPADFKTPMPMPGQEYIAGLHHATTARSRRPAQVFDSVADVKRALQRNEIDFADPVVVRD